MNYIKFLLVGSFVFSQTFAINHWVLGGLGPVSPLLMRLLKSSVGTTNTQKNDTHPMMNGGVFVAVDLFNPSHSVEMVYMLLKQLARNNNNNLSSHTLDSDGTTLLHLLCKNGTRNEFVQWMKQHGVIHQADRHGNFPVHYLGHFRGGTGSSLGVSDVPLKMLQKLVEYYGTEILNEKNAQGMTITDLIEQELIEVVYNCRLGRSKCEVAKFGEAWKYWFPHDADKLRFVNIEIRQLELLKYIQLSGGKRGSEC